MQGTPVCLYSTKKFVSNRFSKFVWFIFQFCFIYFEVKKNELKYAVKYANFFKHMWLLNNLSKNQKTNKS